MSLQGRALAALGQTSAAAAAFERAAHEAHTYGLWLLEAFALRDLKLLVLDDLGHGDHGSRRLGAVLGLLSSPASELTPLLMEKKVKLEERIRKLRAKEQRARRRSGRGTRARASLMEIPGRDGEHRPCSSIAIECH